MLTLSEPAVDLLVHTRSQNGIPDDAMLRVAPSSNDGEQGGISLGFVDQPMDGDHTTSSHGLDVCVAPEVADALDQVTIDVQAGEPDVGDAPQLVLVPAE